MILDLYKLAAHVAADASATMPSIVRRRVQFGINTARRNGLWPLELPNGSGYLPQSPDGRIPRSREIRENVAPPM